MLSLHEKLKLYQVLPYLSLPSNKKDNKNVTVWDFKQRKNLVLFFHHGFKCPYCSAKLKEIEAVYTKIQEEEAEVLAVSFDSVKDAEAYAEKEGIKFPLLTDVKSGDSAAFTDVDESKQALYPTLLITDRFNALRYQKTVEEADKLPPVKEIVDWLDLIQLECPECSHL